MRFGTILTSALAACVSLLSVSVSAAPVDLEKRTPDLPSHIHGPATFYRAITAGELAHIGNYPKGGHPKEYLHVPGDFAHDGALYVFSDLNQAKMWGDGYCGLRIPKEQFYYLVKFKYTPNKALTTKSFTSGTAEWKAFVNASYRNKGAHYDILEGPISIGHGERMQAAMSGGNMIYQAGFVGEKALATLVVEEVTRHRWSGAKDRWCPSCIIL